jgi:6,7-dimethyl-8-ribityllumazine synthase
MNKLKIIEADKISDRPKIAIVSSKYNSYVVDRLIDGCLLTLLNGGVDENSITIIKVPGAYEIPVIVRKLADKKKYECIITLGAIIKGETPHFDIIANSISLSISHIAIEFSVPVIFGILTVNTSMEAMDRSGEEESNKGSEAAKTALEMISVIRQIETE